VIFTYFNQNQCNFLLIQRFRLSLFSNLIFHKVV